MRKILRMMIFDPKELKSDKKVMKNQFYEKKTYYFLAMGLAEGMKSTGIIFLVLYTMLSYFV